MSTRSRARPWFGTRGERCIEGRTVAALATQDREPLRRRGLWTMNLALPTSGPLVPYSVDSAC